MRLWLALGAMAVLTACSRPAASCYALSDRDAVDRIARDYAAEPASARGDPAQMQFGPSRVMGIGRNAVAESSGRYLTQVWFSQDDHTATVAVLSQDCAVAYRPGLDPAAIRSAAYPAKAPRF